MSGCVRGPEDMPDGWQNAIDVTELINDDRALISILLGSAIAQEMALVDEALTLKGYIRTTVHAWCHEFMSSEDEEAFIDDLMEQIEFKEEE